MRSQCTESPTAGSILALALPALGVLIATPLFLLLDTALIGQYGGATLLAALATGTTLYAIVTTQLTFLSYGTTARAARLFGAGHKDEAVAEGVQATWVAIAIGLMLLAIMWFGAPVFTLWLSDNDEIASLATSWLRVVSFAIPLVLVDMAGNGWLRGVQNTRAPLVFTLAGIIPGAILIPILVYSYGLIGSAWATLIGTAITAACFLSALVRAHLGSWLPQWSIISNQLVLGRDLILRSLAFQVALISAAAVAGRFGAAALGAHQVLLQLWNFIALVLDSLAIAAQSMVGAALGAGRVAVARSVGVKVMLYSVAFSLVLAVVLAAGYVVVPSIFTSDAAVIAALFKPWWQLVLLVPVGGVVFALDGVLLGAGDAAFLRSTTLVAATCGYVPGIWLAYVFDTGLVGVWWGLVAFMFIRLLACGWRFQSMQWARV
ncbi:putative efflux protein, MATE family [Corynebacterium mustelae]|uniref:Putative efflux protein, MATE family n=1 Tax=Corynebacterium mustelae TaxID=571915 RepID=A0A0G3H0A1_9CORY|nr:MATE family efflux transporter [Corynebacterium mustelae]AKK06175.1 putative efflux protein, MATE family [Corynebacterium mustelae]